MFEQIAMLAAGYTATLFISMILSLAFLGVALAKTDVCGN
jgi:hypothetical protein